MTKNANQENVMLMKGDTVLMDQYYVTYQERRYEDPYVYYDVDYLKVNTEGRYEKQFSLSPFVQLNQQMGNVPEPSTKHFWDRDIFTHITYADLESLDSASQNRYGEADTLKLQIGDSIFSSNAVIVIESFDRNIDLEALSLNEDDIALGLNILAKNLKGESYKARPVMVIRGNRVFGIADEIDEFGLKFNFSGVDPDSEKLSILLSEKNANAGEFVIMQAIVFPYINVLWIGCIVMVLGSILAVVQRIRTDKSMA